MRVLNFSILIAEEKATSWRTGFKISSMLFLDSDSKTYFNCATNEADSSSRSASATCRNLTEGFFFFSLLFFVFSNDSNDTAAAAAAAGVSCSHAQLPKMRMVAIFQRPRQRRLVKMWI
jgi:hypothetical protein